MTELSSPSYPVLPLRDIVVFPHMIVPLFVGREKSVRALEAVMKDDKQILLASQKDASEDEPKAEGIYRVGVLANVLQLLKLPDGTVKVLVEGKVRVRSRVRAERGLFRGRGARRSPRPQKDPAAIKALSPRGGRGVRALRQAEPQHPGGGGLGGLRHACRRASSPTPWPGISASSSRRSRSCSRRATSATGWRRSTA